jgi:hypothetical protein
VIFYFAFQAVKILYLDVYGCWLRQEDVFFIVYTAKEDYLAEEDFKFLLILYMPYLN